MPELQPSGGWRSPERKTFALLLLTAAAVIVAVLRDWRLCVAAFGGIALTALGVLAVRAFRRANRVIRRAQTFVQASHVTVVPAQRVSAK